MSDREMMADLRSSERASVATERSEACTYCRGKLIKLSNNNHYYRPGSQLAVVGVLMECSSCYGCLHLSLACNICNGKLQYSHQGKFRSFLHHIIANHLNLYYYYLQNSETNVMVVGDVELDSEFIDDMPHILYMNLGQKNNPILRAVERLYGSGAANRSRVYVN